MALPFMGTRCAVFHVKMEEGPLSCTVIGHTAGLPRAISQGLACENSSSPSAHIPACGEVQAKVHGVGLGPLCEADPYDVLLCILP